MYLSLTDLPPSYFHLANYYVIVFLDHTQIFTALAIALLVSFILLLAAPQVHYTSIWYKLCDTTEYNPMPSEIHIVVVFYR